MTFGLTGKNLVGQLLSHQGKKTFRAVDPSTGELIEPSFYIATESEVSEAVNASAHAHPVLQRKSGKEIAKLLQAISENLQSIRSSILSRYMLESGLDANRAAFEFQRTLLQIAQYEQVALAQDWRCPSIDTGIENGTRKHPDIRKMNIGIGPVVVFGASNFPLAYSTAGTDTISALSAGCPVIVKAHPFHPGTSELVAGCIQQAVSKCDFPAGTFSHLFDDGYSVARQLVLDPIIKAVGFTGSESGGRALFDLAQTRLEPIPVFAEMGSCNPVVILPEDIKDSGVDWSVQLANSITQGSGQFCTKPGLIFTIDTPATEEFITVLTRQIMASEEHVMLHPQIAEKYKHNLQEIHDAGIEMSTSSNTLSPTGTIAISRCTGTAFLINPTLQREVFGPFALLISCTSYAEFERCLLSLRGQLTASIFCSESELLEQAVIVDALRKIAGRVIFNGVPTGVTVCPSMHHGGPYPAATDSRFTSVGIDAICRFSRPQVFQNWPDNALPDALKNKNPDRINRRVDGKWTFTEIV